MKKLYLLKIGGSIITDTKRPNVAKIATMRRIFREIKEASKKGDFDLIIGHGSGSFAHIPAKKYRINEGLSHKFSRKGAAITHLVAKQLNDIFLREGLESGLYLFPFSPSSFGLWGMESAKEGTVAHMKEAIRRGIMPVTYGDVVFDLDKGVSIASTERVFEFLAGKLKPDKIILATDVDGVFDKNPKKHKDAKLISKVHGKNINRILKLAGGSTKVDVTGGMYKKILLLYRMVRFTRSRGMIINGMRKNSIRDALLGRKVACTNVVS